jgi:hypothetical protein
MKLSFFTIKDYSGKNGVSRWSETLKISCKYRPTSNGINILGPIMLKKLFKGHNWQNAEIEHATLKQ